MFKICRSSKKTWCLMILRNLPWTSETLGHTHLDCWKNTGPSRAKLNMTRRAVAWRVIRCRGWLDVSMALRRLLPLRLVLLIFDEVNLMYISCTYLSAIDTRMKINFGQIWCPEADCSSSCSWTWSLAHESKILKISENWCFSFEIYDFWWTLSSEVDI